MEYLKITDELPQVSRICLGTWAIGGWLWGGTDEQISIDTIHKAIDLGINIIDTAPVYGFGQSELIVGKALQSSSRREKVLIATKTGLEWQADEKVFRNTTPAFMRKEIEDSLRRLQTDVIDIYQIHWPDPLVPMEEVAATMQQLRSEGKIRAIGVSNFSREQIEAFQAHCPVHTSQPPYNLLEREADETLLPYCNQQKIVSLAYGALCRGLLSGRMAPDTTFEGDDLRTFDPKFQQPRYGQYLQAVAQLAEYAAEIHNKSVLALAIRWILDRGHTIALWGARRPTQLDAVTDTLGWSLTPQDMIAIDTIITNCVTDPVGPEFMQSPTRAHAAYKGSNPQ